MTNLKENKEIEGQRLAATLIILIVSNPAGRVDNNNISTFSEKDIISNRPRHPLALQPCSTLLEIFDRVPSTQQPQKQATIFAVERSFFGWAGCANNKIVIQFKIIRN